MEKEPKVAIEDALGELNNSEKNISKIEKALASKSSSTELTNFILTFATKKDCQMLIQLLGRLHENPQVLKKKNSFETVYNVGVIDGERGLFRKFMNLVVAANSADTETIDSLLNK